MSTKCNLSLNLGCLKPGWLTNQGLNVSFIHSRVALKELRRLLTFTNQSRGFLKKLKKHPLSTNGDCVIDIQYTDALEGRWSCSTQSQHIAAVRLLLRRGHKGASMRSRRNYSISEFSTWSGYPVAPRTLQLHGREREIKRRGGGGGLDRPDGVIFITTHSPPPLPPPVL